MEPLLFGAVFLATLPYFVFDTVLALMFGFQLYSILTKKAPPLKATLKCVRFNMTCPIYLEEALIESPE